MAAQQYHILGRVPPTSRPIEQQNRFVRLYDDTGLRLHFESKDDVYSMVEDPMYRNVFDTYDTTEATRVHFPAVVELEVPWSIGLPQGDQQLPSSFQHALCIQLCPQLSRCSAELPGLNDMGLCLFSNLCRLHIDDQVMRLDRASEGIKDVVPIFHGPRVKTVLEKKRVETIADGTRERQYWRRFQFCANCRAARAVRRCSHYIHGAMVLAEEVCEVMKGKMSDLDFQYGPPPGRVGKACSEFILGEDVGNWDT